MTKIPEGLNEAIENERGNLARVEALLGCLAIAMEYGGSDLAVAPDYGDVVKMARDLLGQSIKRLDSLNLEKTLDDQP